MILLFNYGVFFQYSAKITFYSVWCSLSDKHYLLPKDVTSLPQLLPYHSFTVYILSIGYTDKIASKMLSYSSLLEFAGGNY